MRAALFASILFHGLIVFVATSDLFDWRESDLLPAMEVSIVEYDEIVPQEVARTRPEPEPDPEPEPESEPEPERTVEAPEPEPDVVAPEPERVVEEVKESAKPEPEPSPVPEPVAKPARVTKDIPNVSPRDKPEKPSNFDVTKIAALLDKREASEKPKSRPEPAESQKAESRPNNIKQAKRIASLKEATHAQIARCWSPPSGAVYAETLIVPIQIRISPDGHLLSTRILEQARYKSDSFYRAAADAARRAIQKCAPLDLPVEYYDDWKETKLNFDPSKMK